MSLLQGVFNCPKHDVYSALQLSLRGHKVGKVTTPKQWVL